MGNLFVNISRALMNGLYRLYRSSGTRRNEVVFLSRQTDEPSYDFEQLAREFSDAGWIVHMHLKKVRAANLPSYAVHVLHELKLLATCRMAVLDRYDPVVSLLNFDCEQVEPALQEQARKAHRAGSELHIEFPAEPVVVQLWHAFGAYKKFGYQSIGTREGHRRRTIDTFNIHRNYSWVACSGEGNREAFAEAFAYPVERIVAYRRPEYYELAELKEQRQEQAGHHDEPAPGMRILMAPTLRKSKDSAHPFRDLYENQNGFREALCQAGLNAHLEWSFHPLEEKLPAPGNASQALLDADLLITDYSSIVYEAYLLDIPVLFYIPDIEAYRTSPGLNIDPALACPELCSLTQDDLVASIVQALNAPAAARERLVPFAAPAFDIDAPSERPSLLDAIEEAASRNR